MSVHSSEQQFDFDCDVIFWLLLLKPGLTTTLLTDQVNEYVMIINEQFAVDAILPAIITVWSNNVLSDNDSYHLVK